MPSIPTLPRPRLPTVFRRKHEPMRQSMFSSTSSSESIEASTQPYILENPLITPGGTPGWANQPWHYVFKNGDVAWALGGNGRWRLVTVVGDGFMERIEDRKQIAYDVTWMSGGTTMRGTFAPGCGDLKPDTLAIRRLLIDEGSRCVERRDWEMLNEEEDEDIEYVQDETSETDGQT